MKELLAWMRKQDIPDKMLWKRAAIDQEIFVRDTICCHLLGVHGFVISTHTSKSIQLPVYGFTMKNGIKVMMRENFYGWCVSVEIPTKAKVRLKLPEDVIEGKGYFEGFKNEWIHQQYSPNNPLQKKFSFDINSDYDLYMVMYHLKHAIPERKIPVKGVTKDQVRESIERIYNTFGCAETFIMENETRPRPLMEGYEVLEYTHALLTNYKFYEKHGLEYKDVMDVSDNPELFAGFIVNYPELLRVFKLEEAEYNQTY